MFSEYWLSPTLLLGARSRHEKSQLSALDGPFWRHAMVHNGVKYSNGHGPALDDMVRPLIMRLPPATADDVYGIRYMLCSQLPRFSFPTGR
jgi:hypothetical protein